MTALEADPAHGAPRTVAFVTPTFPPDLQRCELLVESLDLFAPDVRHYLIIDHADMPRFAHLRSRRTILVPSEEVIDRSFRRPPGSNGYWLSWRTLPVRGWMTQQLRKLASPRVIDEDVIVCIDSDTAFVRPFSMEHLVKNDRIGLLDVGYVDETVTQWTGIAERLLGLPPGRSERRGHVGYIVAWSRDHILGLQRHIEQAMGLPWQVAIARNWTFSEYILYGVYIRHVLGYEFSHHVPTDRPLVRQPWDHDLMSQEAIRRYVLDLEPGNIAVMFHSKGHVPIRVIASAMREALSRHI